MKRICTLSSMLMATLAMASPFLAHGQSEWTLPVVAEGPEARQNCLVLIGFLPVMKNPQMREIANTPDVYSNGGNAIVVNAVASLAKAGDADALFSLGMLFETGNCFDSMPDRKRAQSLYIKAAALGSVEAKQRVRE